MTDTDETPRFNLDSAVLTDVVATFISLIRLTAYAADGAPGVSAQERLYSVAGASAQRGAPQFR